MQLARLKARMAWATALLVTASVLLVQAKYEFTIVENTGDSHLVGLIDAAEPSFGGPSEAVCNRFFIIDSTGRITTNGNIDRELVVEMTNSDRLECIVNHSPLQTADTVIINILDENDNIPRFFHLEQPNVESLSENASPQHEIARLEPVDKDKNENGTTTFEITRGNEGGYFAIEAPLGTHESSPLRILVLLKSLSTVSSNTQFNLTVTITDMAENPLVFNQVIVINIEPPAEPPTFAVTSVVYNVVENQALGNEYSFATLTASNVDQVNGDIFYSILDSNKDDDFDVRETVNVNRSTGELYLNQSLDYEDQKQIQFRVTASNPSSSRFDDIFVTINVEDVNDNHPYCVNCQTIHSSEENRTIDIFFVITDDDDSLEFKSIQNNLNITSSNPNVPIPSNYTVQALTDTLSLIRFAIKPLDREQTPNFTMTVIFFNDAEPFLSGSITIFVTILDINDNTPQFVEDIFTLRVAEGSPIGKEIFILQAFDEDEGKNGAITYAIVSVDDPIGEEWFYLSPTNGTLFVASSDIDYTAAGNVTLVVSATDNSNDSFTTFAQVVVKISPTLTFLPNSYVEYEHFDIVSSDSYAVYLELRTKRTEGLILFQQGDAGNTILLELTDGRLRFQHGSSVAEGVQVVSDDLWHSVLLKKQDEISLQVWETQAETELVAETLSEATLFGCDPQDGSLSTGSLFIGGVNLFSLDESVLLRATEFVGTIRSVLINNSQIDLGCPTDQVNIMNGFHYTNACSTKQCENEHTAGCVDFAPEPYCKCIGGFPPASCQPLPDPDQEIDGSENSYAPIRFYGDARADLQLDYNFFSDLEAQRRQVKGVNTERRKRAAQLNETLQSIHISFKLVNVQRSVLLFATTQTTTHRLEISVSENEDIDAIIYVATNRNTLRDDVYIPVRLRLQNMTVYDVTITLSQENAILSVTGDNQVEETGNADWRNDYTAFVEQPSTVLSIGGAENGQDYFEGCIRRVAIDRIEIPLTGLLSLTPEEGGFMAGTKAPEMYCELCDLTRCSNNSECVRAAIGEPICTCQTGFALVESQCIPIATDVPTGGVTGTTSNTTTYIIAGSVSAFVLILSIVLCIVFVSTCCKKRERQKRTYSVTNMAETPGSSVSSKPNQFVHMQPRDNPMMTTLNTANGIPRHDRGSSVSTFQEHAEDGDPEMETPRRFSRRKSTVSAESGIRTDTDQEVSLRSIPRMEDSGNEKDTDYSEEESGSDDLSSTCFVQPPPISLQLVSSANSIPGMASSVSSPHTLTPKERKMITPLRPPSTALSASEFEDTHHHDDDDDDDETDVETGYPYSHHTLPSSLSRNSSTRHSGRRGSNGGETSRISSASSGGSKWYKASTASDTEREKERMRSNKAYYSQRTESGKYPTPPEYLSPPTFEPRTDKSVPYPNTRRSRMPINLTESPISRNNKNGAYQFPYEHTRTPDARLQDPRLRYDNHRLKHEYSLPKGHPSVALSSASSSSGRPRHNADAMLASAFPQSPPAITPHYPRHFSVSGPGSSIPHYTASYQYSRSYSSENKGKKQPEQKFQDLKSVSTINPISYWEMQDRMNKTAVDQVDPYQILSEPYVQFEDVSTDPSVYESQITQDGPEHQDFCSQGGGERPAELLVPHLSDSEIHDNSTIISETDLAPRMPIFPSADCTPSYTATLVASSSSSGGSTPKTPNVFALSSQHVFDV